MFWIRWKARQDANNGITRGEVYNRNSINLWSFSEILIKCIYKNINISRKSYKTKGFVISGVKTANLTLINRIECVSIILSECTNLTIHLIECITNYWLWCVQFYLRYITPFDIFLTFGCIHEKLIPYKAERSFKKVPITKVLARILHFSFCIPSSTGFLMCATES